MNPDEETTLVTTDEAILDSIGEGNEQDASEGTGDQGTGTQTDTTEAASTASSEQGTTDGSGTEQQQAARGPQDLVGADGNVIAKSGAERRHYETAQRERNRANQAEDRLKTAEAKLDAVNNAGTLGTQYNLTPEELTIGAQLINAYKENPVETIQYMLTQAQSNGHNIDALLGGGTDMSAIQQMLDNALQPFTQAHREQQDTQEATVKATEIYNNFNAQHPDAVVHENSLARLLQQDNTLTVDAAYYKLQNYYLQRNLDWTKSLETLQQEQQAQGTSVNTQPQPPEGGVVNANVTNKAQVADVSTSTSDIIREAMAEAGINN